MTADVHFYTRPQQPATRYEVAVGVGRRLQRHIFRRAAGAPVWVSCCNRLRRAGNCTTQVYYDAQYIWCAPGKGCKVPSRRRRVTRRALLRLFASGVSTRALARRYGQPVREIERRLRERHLAVLSLRTRSR